ncbi:MAG: hypothetical protein KJ737_27505 [Proteobacteria bacterium]|nr:hypothetical protein [Pseudomonadota bacterium]
MEKADILSLLSQNRKDCPRYYKKWVSADKEDDVTETLNRKRWPVSLGSQSFIDMIKERYGEEKIRREVPISRDLLPDAHRIMEAVCKSYETTTQDILKMQRGKWNDARNVSIYLIRKLRKDTLNEIGKVFGIDNDSTVSSVLERIKKRMAKDRHLSEQVNKIVESLKTGQERT